MARSVHFEVRDQTAVGVRVWTGGVADIFETHVFDPRVSDEPFSRHLWATREDAIAGHCQVLADLDV